MIHAANALIYTGLTAAAALAVGLWYDWRMGCLIVPIGAVLTGILLAMRGTAK